jgi:hypothetical protein
MATGLRIGWPAGLAWDPRSSGRSADAGNAAAGRGPAESGGATGTATAAPTTK